MAFGAPDFLGVFLNDRWVLSIVLKDYDMLVCFYGNGSGDLVLVAFPSYFR